jgi:hypothetical protein
MGLDKTGSGTYPMAGSDNSSVEFSYFLNRGLTSDLDYREIGFKAGR